MSIPKIAVLIASGTNRYEDVAEACTMAGMDPEVVHINSRPTFDNYQALILPGGFSYGDSLGAGKRLALELQTILKDAMRELYLKEKPVIGICNGFQALIKSGVFGPNVSLTYNRNRKFECRWVTMIPNKECISPIISLMAQCDIECPIAHGEGRFAGRPAIWHIAFTYSGSEYPNNPNGSEMNIAGLCDKSGLIIGMMPHPENYIHYFQHPKHTRKVRPVSGLYLFNALANYLGVA